jgi:hypothetical protein
LKLFNILNVYHLEFSQGEPAFYQFKLPKSLQLLQNQKDCVTLVSRFGSARGLGVLARVPETAICIAFSGCRTQLSRGSPAGRMESSSNYRAMGLLPRLPMSPQDSISRSHPSSEPAALCSPVQCNMQRCASRMISAHSSSPDACVRL